MITNETPGDGSLPQGTKAEPMSVSARRLGSSIFVYNVGLGGPRSLNDAGLGDTLLEAFIACLRNINDKGYVVQGAAYGVDGGSIFIDTDDADWNNYAHCGH